MKSPALETTADNLPILIVDKLGLVGKAIADNLETQQPVFFASGRNGEVLEEKNKNIVFLKYPQNKNKIPSIPNLSYAYFFIVWNGEKEILESLSEFIKKSKEEKAKFIFITNLFTAKETLIKKIKSAHPDGKIIILGDLFGKPVSVKTHSPINKIIYQAFLNKKIRLENAGLGRLYPVFFEDAIKILLEIVLNEKKESPGVYFLFPRHPSTQLSFSRILQKIDPLIAVDFSNKVPGEEPVIPGEGNYALSENYSLRGKIDQLLEELDISEDIDEGKIINSSERMTTSSGKNNGDKKRKRNIFLPFIIFILLAIFLPVITTAVFSLLGVKLLSDAKDNLEKGKYELAYKDILLSQKSFNFAETSSSLLVSEAKLIGKENDARSVVLNIQTGKDVSAAAGFSLNALLKFEGTFLGKSLNPKDDFVDGLNNLKDALRIFQKMQSKNPDNGIEKKLFSIINSYNSSIKIVANTADVLPVLFGFDNKKTYLVLFQNNMELRPGGGFIGSYGILNLDKGKVESFNLHDVYDADGQLKGHIEPPFAIRRYIPLVHLYLRDSNFDVDFSNSASASAYMLNQEKGQIVDGVIFLYYSFF